MIARIAGIALVGTAGVLGLMAVLYEALGRGITNY